MATSFIKEAIASCLYKKSKFSGNQHMT